MFSVKSVFGRYLFIFLITAAWISLLFYDLMFALAIPAILIYVSFWLIRPKQIWAILLVLTVFAQSLEQLTSLNYWGMLDELLVLSVVASALLRMTFLKLIRVRVPGSGFIFVFTGLGIASGILMHVDNVLLLQGAFLAVKGFLFAWGTAQLDWNKDDLEKSVKTGVIVILFVLACACTNLVISDVWESYLSRARGGSQYRAFGLPSLIGPFVHPNVFGQFMALASIATILYISVFGFTFSRLILGAITVIGAAFSFRRKAILGLLVGLFAPLVANRKSRIINMLIVLLVFPLSFLLLYDEILNVISYTKTEYLDVLDKQSRYILYRDSLAIAVSYFPLGAGFSRFGSFLAGENYSPEYISRGYEKIWGMGQGDQGGFLYDTFWPSVLGETGFIGLAAFFLALLLIMRMGYRVSKNSECKLWTWSGLLLVGWSFEFLIESAAAPVYVSPPLYLVYFALIGLVSKEYWRQRINVE